MQRENSRLALVGDRDNLVTTILAAPRPTKLGKSSVSFGLSFLIWKMGKAIPPSSPRGPSHDCKYGPNSSAPNLMPHFTQERGVAPSPGSQSLTSLSRPTLWGDRSLPPPGRWEHGVGSSVERAQTPGAEATLRVGSSGPQDHVAGVTCQDTLSWGLTPECRRVPTHASRPRTRAPAPSVGWNVPADVRRGPRPRWGAGGGPGRSESPPQRGRLGRGAQQALPVDRGSPTLQG